MKKIILIIYLLNFIAPVFADNIEKDDKNSLQIVPLVQYDFLSTEKQEVQSGCIGSIIKNDTISLTSLYAMFMLNNKPEYDYPDRYHLIDILLEANLNRHKFMSTFKSKSDKPVYGGFNTYLTAVVYGYEFLQLKNLSLVIGGGFAVGEFDVELPNGKDLNLIPLPYIKLDYKSHWLVFNFDFIAGPSIDLTIAPESRLRFNTQCRMDEFRDMRDLIFESSLMYRFFETDSESGDFAGIAIGIKNDNYGAFKISSDDDSYELHYYSAFAKLDLSVINVTAGYAFKGRELYDGEHRRDTGNGFFMSVQGMYMF